MTKKKCFISLGQINKYIIFAFLGGISKCFVSIMLYKFNDYAKYDKHPLIIVFNAGIGMSLSFFPFLILKINSYKLKKKAKVNNYIRTFSTTGSIIKPYSKEFNDLVKHDITKKRIQKYLILLACAFLDFSQKLLSFLLNKYIINNIWIFNICFISIFEYCIMKRKLYKHQYLSSLIITVLGIVATIIGLLKVEDNIFIKILLCVFIEIQYSLAIVLKIQILLIIYLFNRKDNNF